MPNLAFHLEVLDQVMDKLVAQNDPRGTLMKNNHKFAALGALGPDMLRYLPISANLSNALSALVNSTPVGQISTLTLPQLQELFLNPVGAIYAVLFRQLVVANWPVINQITAFLNKLDAIAAAQDELAIPGVLGELQTILNEAQTLEATLPNTVPNIASLVGQILVLPPWLEQTLTLPVTPADPTANRLSEFLRWHKTGAFVRNLEKAAKTDAEKAFVLGWMVHIAGSVTGEPFVANITGGPYRTHWWRNRLVSNFVNSWTFGFFGAHASMNGDTPTPIYADWPALCSHNMQDVFNVAGFADGVGDDVPLAVKAMASGNLGTLPNQFPAAIANLLQAAVTATYPANTRPIAGFSADIFKQAALGSFAVYWFMTSGSGPMCNNKLGNPPPTCLVPPPWISTGSTPTPQQAGLNPAGAVTAILLAIFALFSFLFGDVAGGLAALAAALAAPVINWPTVVCNLFWLRNQLVNAENALRDALVTGGLAYPPPAKLGTTNASNVTQPALDQTSPTGVPLTKTNTLSSAVGVMWTPTIYPRQMDTSLTAADLDFGSYPLTAPLETSATQNLVTPDMYPNFVVNGAGLQNGGLMNSGPFPSQELFFGDAVSNALAIIASNAGKLPDYNLDADRGDGWLGWHPQPGSTPSTPPVVAVQD